MEPSALRDPLKLAAVLWPDVELYDKQRDIVQSVWLNDKTVVPAGNMLGKDFVSALILLLFFLTRHPCRVVTTSVDHSQLEGVLWGEVRRFIQTSSVPLDAARGGPLVINHLHLRKMFQGKVCGLSYAIGRVAAKGEGMLGHHIADVGDGEPRTLFMADEASGVDDESQRRAETWADRELYIGNPYPCSNFFFRDVTAGDVMSPDGGRCYTRVIRIRAEDSPNVRWGLTQRRAGVEPDGRTVLEGVLPWCDYVKRRATWDVQRQCVSLDAQFYLGREAMLFPAEWLNAAEAYADKLRGSARRAVAGGCDPGQGISATVGTAVDRLGVMEQESVLTPDTSDVVSRSLAFMRRHSIPPERFVFDAGGGGVQHADRLRLMGYPVRSVAFGEAPTMELKRGVRLLEERREHREERYAYKNRRAQMYGELRQLLDPSGPGFAIPAEYSELRRQLSMIPLTYDPEGRLELLPKSRRGTSVNATQRTLTELLGRSPDEADSLVLAVHAMLHEHKQAWAGTL